MILISLSVKQNYDFRRRQEVINEYDYSIMTKFTLAQESTFPLISWIRFSEKVLLIWRL